MSNRPPIPEDIKQEVRKKSYFGCVICGLPIYHYDHIEEYSIVKKHEASNITLLCPNHHQDKTSKRLDSKVIIRASENPKNKNNSMTSRHQFLMAGTKSIFNIGGNKYIFNYKNTEDYFCAIKIINKIVFGVHFVSVHTLPCLASNNALAGGR